MKNSDEVMEFLLRFTDYEKITRYKYDVATFNLERVERLLAAVGSPHLAFRSVHVAGTKGKGSTAAMVAAMLRAAGLRVGVFSSPHLVRLEERMTVDGELMPEAELVALANDLAPYTEGERSERPGESPTFFELVTAMGFMHFARHAVDFGVIEVGMGGRLDSTNVIVPEVAAITRIDFDHVERLGRTLARIAAEKGGIIKEGVPVVVSAQAPEADAVLREIARARGARMVRVGEEVRLGTVETGLDDAGPFCRFDLQTRAGEYAGLELALLGEHQAMNAATAVGVVEALAERCGVAVGEEAIRPGLAAARCPARIEIFAGEPTVILDGAHNPVSMRVLRGILDGVFAGRRVALVFAVAKDKDVDAILETILPCADGVIFTLSGSARSMAPDALAEKARALVVRGVEVEPEAEVAFTRARELAGKDGLVCVTGSLYLAGKLRPRLVAEQI